MIASVLVCVTWPAATLVICRSFLRSPTLTVPTGVAPANPLNVTPLTVALLVGLAAAVNELAPSATELFVPATAPLPMAMALLALPTAPVPMATASVPVAVLSAPVEFAWKYLMPWLLMLLIAEPTLLAVDVVPFAL
ncbi:Tash protein PEST motif family protein [Burkholderia lata]|nr:Tash protein PEST motif family protein [Burkholderia lata]